MSLFCKHSNGREGGDRTVTIRFRRIVNNRLLSRREIVIDVIHCGLATVPKAEIRRELAKAFKTATSAVFVFGLRTMFGGTKATGFALIYDSDYVARKFEPKHRLREQGQSMPLKRRRKQVRAGLKNWRKRFRGTKKPKVLIGERTS